jgi:hypothetical protein
VRGLQKEPEDPLAADPMFRYARRYLPSQAGLYSYRNDRLNMEITWEVLKQMVRDLAEQTADDEAEGLSQYEESPMFPIMAMLQEASKYVDLTKLPEFGAIAKYFGATVSYVQDRPEGIYSETTALKPPQGP